MKKTFLLSICMIIGAGALYAQQTIYIIDNETVEHFDGSQLKGKYIRDYKITSTGSGRNTVTVHSISTSSSFSIAEPNKQPIGRMELSEPPLLTTKPLGQPTGQMMEIAEPVIGSTINTAPGIGSKATRAVQWADDSAEKFVYIVDGIEVPKAFLQSLPDNDIISIESTSSGEGYTVITIKTKSGYGIQYALSVNVKSHPYTMNVRIQNSPDGKGYSVMTIETTMELSELMEELKKNHEIEIDANGKPFLEGQPVTKITINGRSYSVKNGQFELDD
ncbi:MAG: hypothetical protein K6F98_09655 [Bacteroidales bacterium]|nr:hypothetical protein [Bacteroidales bacterium]